MRVLRVAALIAAVVLVGLAGYRFMALQQRINLVETEQLALQEKLEGLELPGLEQEHAVIFLIKSAPTDFYLVPVNRDVTGPVNPTTALQALLNGPLSHEDLEPSVPPTTRLLGLSIYRGLATVNFSGEIIRDFNGGALIESYLIKAVVNTLTEFPEIDRVQFLVEGEPVESIGGHILITDPIERSG